MSVKTIENQPYILKGGAKEQRVIGLDIMRIALALLVFMFHSRIHYQCDYYFFNDFVRMGAIAMTGFFLLSGYVLCTVYRALDLMTINGIKGFYLKRAISIIPLYFFVAIVYAACDFIQGDASINDYLVLFPVEVTGLQSTFSSLFSYSHNGGTWFISCIIICYALYPFIQTVLKQLSNRTRLILLALLSFLLLYAPIVQLYFNLQRIYTNPFYRLLEFFIGILLAEINCSYDGFKLLSIIRNKVTLIIVTLLLVIMTTIAVRKGVPTDFMLFNWIALPCFCCIILALGKIECDFLRESKVILYLSKISFPFFLCQVLPLWALSRKICGALGSDANIIRILVSFTLCFIGAVVMHEFVEIPAARALRRQLLLSDSTPN